MLGSHVEEVCDQVRGRDPGPSTGVGRTSLVIPFPALRDDSSG